MAACFTTLQQVIQAAFFIVAARCTVCVSTRTLLLLQDRLILIVVEKALIGGNGKARITSILSTMCDIPVCEFHSHQP